MTMADRPRCKLSHYKQFVKTIQPDVIMLVNTEVKIVR
jgi:hypothetical protein